VAVSGWLIYKSNTPKVNQTKHRVIKDRNGGINLKLETRAEKSDHSEDMRCYEKNQ